jgi:hypothetical protein
MIKNNNDYYKNNELRKRRRRAEGNTGEKKGVREVGERVE